MGEVEAGPLLTNQPTNTSSFIQKSICFARNSCRGYKVVLGHPGLFGRKCVLKSDCLWLRQAQTVGCLNFQENLRAITTIQPCRDLKEDLILFKENHS